MNEAAKVIYSLLDTRSIVTKKYILKKNANVPLLKDILYFIFNPYARTGIGRTKLAPKLAEARVMKINHKITLGEAVEYFKLRQTGSEADLAFAKLFVASYNDNKDTFNLAVSIVTKDLKVGIGTSTLNAVFGKSFIPVIACMLGSNLDKSKNLSIWPAIVTEKLDGARRILIKDRGKVTFYSRAGHCDDGLLDIAKEAQYLPDNMMYDGELIAEGKYTDSIALRQATNSIASSGGIKEGLLFHVFDMVPLDEFMLGMSKDSALVRKLRLGATFRDESIQLLDDRWAQLIQAYGIDEELTKIRSVPILGYAKNMEHVNAIVEEIWKAGGEGVMLNIATAPYEAKRSKKLLKVKKTKEYKLKVVGFSEGTGKYLDSLGALIVDYKGQLLGVGSGFTDEERDTIWLNKKLYIGRTVEIDSFGQSYSSATGAYSLNCPIFKRFVGGKNE